MYFTLGSIFYGIAFVSVEQNSSSESKIAIIQIISSIECLIALSCLIFLACTLNQ